MNEKRTPLVTIGLPIYKRLEYLPAVLQIVESQDYPALELLVSDNGLNGSKVRDVVHAHYSRPYRFRQNAAIVSISQHFNQLLQEASGEYFLLLCDDDEISSNYVSKLIEQLQSHPAAAIAIARQELIDISGTVVRQSQAMLPQSISGEDFIVRTWRDYEFGFECFATFLMPTAEARARGGYPDFNRGSGNDNALLIRLCLDREVVFSSEAVFRWRIDEGSHGWSLRASDLAMDTREFLDFLTHDPVVSGYAVRQPRRWNELKQVLTRMSWHTYFYRWNDIYRNRLSPSQWIRAAFLMPFIVGYYRQVTGVLALSAMQCIKARLRRFFPSLRRRPS